MASRKGDKSGEEILEKMNEITKTAVAHTDELVKSVGCLVAEQKEKVEALLKGMEDKLTPELQSLENTMALIENTTERVDEVLACEAKRMKQELCLPNVEVPRAAKAVHFDAKTVQDAISKDVEGDE